MQRTLFENGLVWQDGTLRHSAVVVHSGLVESILPQEAVADFTAEQRIDLNGKWLLPAGIDIHTHISDGAETFLPGTSCAAAGGIGTLFDMAPFHACVTVEQMKAKAAKAAGECVTDFGLVAGIVIDESDLEHLDQLAGIGAAYFKVFQPSNPPVSAGTIWKAVQAAAHTGLRLALHAEEPTCLLPPGDPADPLSFPHSRPVVAETSSAAAMIEMAAAAGAPVHICHVSSARTADLVARGKSMGVDVTCEVPAHYLLLDESAFAIYGARVKTTPPLRSRTDADGLLQALAEGIIDAVACDHYTEHLAPISIQPHDIPDAAAGIAGLETSLPLLMDLVLRGSLDLARFVEACAQIPAELMRVARFKGCIAPGKDADFSIWDPNAEWRVGNLGPFSRVATTPYDGWLLKGKLCQTWIRGRQVWDGEKICAPQGYGRWTKSL